MSFSWEYWHILSIEKYFKCLEKQQQIIPQIYDYELCEYNVRGIDLHAHVCAGQISNAAILSTSITKAR